MKHQLPDVVHVGFSKCASTFLRSFFSEHPQTFLVSDAHFFVPFERSNYDRGLEYYSALFGEALPDQITVESDEHIVLPLLHPVLRAAATTVESVSQALKRVEQVAPDTKIIMIVRNQFDLMLSRYGEYISSGRDIDFEPFVNEFLCSSRDQINYFQNHYFKIVCILHRHFSPQNVLLLLQEELYSNESEVIRRICEFVGVRVADAPRERTGFASRFFSLDAFQAVARSGKRSKNTGLSYLGIKVMRQWNRLTVAVPEEAYYRKVTAKVPYPLYKFGVRAIRVVDYFLPNAVKGNKKSMLTPSIVAKLRKEFDADNKLLGGMIGRDLARLGYY